MQAVIPFPDIGAEALSVTILGIELALRWYALAYIAGLLIGWGIVAGLMARPAFWPGGRAPFAPRRAEDLLTWVILGVILGGRLGYVIFYKPLHFLQNPWEILMLWQGGMAFHGGFAGVVLAVWWWCGREGAARLSVADALALAAAPGLMLGRLANFVNAELWGRATDVPWAMVFPTDPLGLPRHPSQLYQAGLEGLVLGLVLLAAVIFGRSLSRPGLTFGLFLAGYGAARFAVEFVRQPDAQFVSPGNPIGFAIGAGDLGLTMGQILSLPMIALGLWLMRRAR